MEYRVTRINQDELYHFGVKGMKWGVRRYQNKDGSYKPGADGRYDDPIGNQRKQPSLKSQRQSIKTDYKAKKKQIDSAYTKAAEKYEKLTDGGVKRNKKAEDEFDKAANKWEADRKTARAEYRQAKKKFKAFKKADKQPNIIERHKNNLIEKYKERGYSQEAAETAAKKRLQTEAFVGAMATVAVAVVATKAAKRIGEDYFDKTLKAGKVIQNIGAYEHATFKDDPFFAAINRHDKKLYGERFPLEKQMMGNPEIFKNQIKLTENVKVPSTRHAKKILENQMKNDPVFREDMLNTLERTHYGPMGRPAINSYRRNGKMSNKLYDQFNRALATPEMQKAGIHKKYYSELKKNGYDAVLDINDTRYSGYKNIAKKPTIFFNGDKLEKIDSTKLDDEAITKNAIKRTIKIIGKDLSKKAAVGVGAGMAVNSIRKQKAIERYLDEHPNSKLTEKEILKAIDAEYLEKNTRQ